ncbi:hypothetical protein PFICI_05925 [Pestalotiopsis fici W106-1]|uniref:Inheritance of peroxisomes protein 1 n=1 Tax=Pestalotiopsis fici (strain W106-1 / CGMCC3.15140) TaxID=1229662 RepID=W3XDF5_PESFW|nr:uncharacterized protein PFICI_05925 [Pestalotiopsis fici W106-1]ETS84049.1 hypothetical protein PFICI_05925 [Pestalotiopsis fici W106-1]
MGPHPSSSSSAHGRLLSPRRVATEPLPLQPPRRSMSVSSASSSRSLAASASSASAAAAVAAPRNSDESIETLFDHPSVKIIAFTSSQRASSFGASDFLAEPKPGSLPASSKLERTLAVGPFRIYRAPGSVAFLSCGSALQPILPKSQCWCIDEINSRFVLQIRRPQYWRIELPLSDPEDFERASALRDVFDNILLFEKTECPFVRSFTVELPERPQTPVKKKPWTPVGKHLVPSVFLSDVSSPSSPAVKIANEKLRRRTLDISSQTHMEARDQAVRNTERALPNSTPRGLADGPHVNVREMAAIAEANQPGSTPDTHLEAATSSSHGKTNETRQGALTASIPASADHHARKELEPTIRDAQGSPRFPISAPITQATTKGSSIVPKTQESAPQPGEDSKELHSIDETKPSEARDDIHTSFEAAGSVGAVNLKKKRMSRILAGRSVTLPPRLTVVTSTPPRPSQAAATEEAPTVSLPARASSEGAPEEQSPNGSVDSFHSVQSWHSPISPPSLSPISSSPSPPLFPYPHDNIRIPHRGSRGTSSAEFTPATDATFVPAPMSVETHAQDNHDSAPALGTGYDEGVSRGLLQNPAETMARSSATPQRPNSIHHRPKTADPSVGRRAFPSMPASANILSPTVRYRPEGPLAVVRRLPSVILQKTVEILLSPPSHLVNLMLQVAAKIAAGEWRGLVLGMGEGGESIPVHWDYSDGELSGWEDDEDYTFSISRLPTSRRSTDVAPDDVSNSMSDKKATRAGNSSRSWEVD